MFTFCVCFLLRLLIHTSENIDGPRPNLVSLIKQVGLPLEFVRERWEGKEKKRREKNYVAAHSGPARLPPSPDGSRHDELPSKLRLLMDYTSASLHDSTKQDVEKKENNTKARVDAAAKENDVMLNNGDEKKNKKKRERNQIKDLRFEQELADLDGRSKRKERKKKYWEAKKQKKNQGKTEDTLMENFQKQEQIRFGDVVQAPPKLAVVPKARKAPMSASKERLRLEAIEAYRYRNGWTSRPGVQIPSLATQ